ncbi:MAG: gamma-glutamyl-gamma-aminobutyrate hydrolase family protein [Alphaproteobacteria bacterium]|nr:gamma-glutamyl-gamma-aminobutyrate hydrolase family protein [Alphaproteobacteria bacterium]
MRPLIGITGCTHPVDDTADARVQHTVGDKYITGVINGADGAPVLLPAMGPAFIADWLERLDGILVTGAISNVEPHHYDGPPSAPGTPHDPARDATTLPLIRQAIAAGVPILCICRGHQELNVALGGSLHQEVHAVPGRFDHRAPTDQPGWEAKYRPMHSVTLSADGVLRRWIGQDEVMVNSLHWQGIDRLADGLSVEAVAPDGQIEAVRVTAASSFAIGVQWHPEFKVREDQASLALFQAFGQAARARATARRAQLSEAAE